MDPMSGAEFPRHPVFHIGLKSRNFNLEPRFEQPATCRECIIKRAPAREVPHAIAIKPLLGARPGIARLQHFDSNLSREHGYSTGLRHGLLLFPWTEGYAKQAIVGVPSHTPLADARGSEG